jgi:hypothetical protein
MARGKLLSTPFWGLSRGDIAPPNSNTFLVPELPKKVDRANPVSLLKQHDTLQKGNVSISCCSFVLLTAGSVET